MTESELINEIDQASLRIKTRQEEIQVEELALESKIKKYTDWAWCFVWVGIVISVISIIYFICKNDDNGFALNLLGDFLGGSVASLWALAGLFFIYVAFLGQKQQLLNQQLELMNSQLEVKYTRLELAGQKAELAEQNKTLRRQRFENTFFQLLSNHQEIVNGIDIRKTLPGGTSAVLHVGRDCFKSFYKSFKRDLNRITVTDKVISKYNEFYNSYQSDLGHYFRNLYHILKFVKESPELAESERWKYSSLLRALLSSYELVFLFYNGLGEHGHKKLKPLLEYFSMLKNIDRNLIIDESHLEIYKQIAFASSEQRDEILKS